jgi:hypothetical protein
MVVAEQTVLARLAEDLGSRWNPHWIPFATSSLLASIAASSAHSIGN